MVQIILTQLSVSFAYNKIKRKECIIHFGVWLTVLSFFLTFSSHTSKYVFYEVFWVLKPSLQILGEWCPTHNCSMFAPFPETTIAVRINCAPVIFSSPALHGYATLRVFRCIIRVSWDLIKITASKIPFKWKCSQKTMADTSSYRLFLFSAHQQGKANPCFHDGRQEGHKLCCFLTLLMLFLSEQPNN